MVQYRLAKFKLFFYGTPILCLVIGMFLLTLCFTFLRRKDNFHKYRTLRIVLAVIGTLSLLNAIAHVFFMLFLFNLFI